MHKLDLKHLASTFAVVSIIFYVICVVFGYVWPRELHNSLFELVYPGVKWLTVGGFFLGLVENLIYYVVGVLIVGGVWNALLKR